ncbi:MAG: hypothetical protein L3J93_06690, partial [Thermoplasmata archaeon]|nr:hypothetical protein [Thermoplasmata archaeon]
KEWREKVLDIAKLPGYDPTNRTKTFQLCLETIAQGRIPIGVMHRPAEGAPAGASLELKLLPDQIGPAAAEIDFASQRGAYEKLLKALA